MGRQRINDTGNKFGMLTVLGVQIINGVTFYSCMCDCGERTEKRASGIRGGTIKSCGCLQKQNSITHGFSKTKNPNHAKIYNIWCKMRQRCCNPNAPGYKSYGAKGIVICERWMSSFISFYEDVGDYPNDGRKYSIDRINRAGNYEPSNVRWATNEQQNRNRGMLKNNTTGVTGVYRKNNKSYGVLFPYYQGYYIDLQGKSHTRSFSVAKYGEEQAFEMACDWRAKAIETLNLKGAGYSEDHGV